MKNDFGKYFPRGSVAEGSTKNNDHPGAYTENKVNKPRPNDSELANFKYRSQAKERGINYQTQVDPDLAFKIDDWVNRFQNGSKVGQEFGPIIINDGSVA
tara:strand:+ start:1184 stop:1483 length:300 start_codon:yes stop_codon:yes gene_type:complete